MKTLEIKVSVTKEDLLQLRHDTFENVSMWLGFAGALGFLTLLPGDSRYVLMGIAAFVFGGWELERHRSVGRALKLWDDVGESTYRFDERGLFVRHSKGERQYDWPTLTSFRDYASALVLYHFDQQSIFIPKRGLDDQQIELLDEWLTCTRNATRARSAGR